jgi:hypothetical protein
MRLEEQTELFAQRIKRLGRFQFFLRPAYAEGDLGSEVSLLSIWQEDRDKETGVYQFPEAPLIHRLRTALAKQSGIPLKRLLAEQEKRIPPSLPATAYPLSPPQPRQTWPQPRRPSRQRKSGSQTSSDFQPRQRTQPQPPPDGAQAASDAAQAIVPLPVGRQGLPTRRRHNLS